MRVQAKGRPKDTVDDISLAKIMSEKRASEGLNSLSLSLSPSHSVNHDSIKQFKALEAMVEQVKPECSAIHITSTSTNKLEKNGSKSRGSGSPFKCIGLGLAQQIKSERDEELSAGRQRIEELEALAASRQKEVGSIRLCASFYAISAILINMHHYISSVLVPFQIFMLNARLAAAESMTHDVIRDLLGLKLDMTNYAVEF